jgi:hypothetical protein
MAQFAAQMTRLASFGPKVSFPSLILHSNNMFRFYLRCKATSVVWMGGMDGKMAQMSQLASFGPKVIFLSFLR